MQYLNPGPSSQNGFHLTNHRQLETDEIQTHIRYKSSLWFEPKTMDSFFLV